MKQRLSLLWMLLLCFVAGAWADTEVSPVGGSSNATVNGTSFSINGTTNAGSGTKISPMTDKGIKVRVNTPLVMTVNAGYRINSVTAYAASNDNSKTFTIEKIEVDGTEYVPSGVTMPITCAQKNASEATTISIPSITARDNITFTFGGTASQGIMEFHVDYTQEQVILQEITDVTLNGASIGETALATLKADKAVTIDGSSLNGIGILDVTLSSGATTVNRAFDGNNVVYTFTTNGGADAYTVTVTGVKKTYAAAQGTVVYYNEDALSNEKKTLTVDGVAFNYATKSFGYANNTAGVTLGETTYKPIKLSTGEAVTVTFPDGKKVSKIIVYGWSAGGLGTGKLVNFTDGGEKSVDTSNDIFFANDGAGSVYPSVYEYEVDNWEAFTFQGNGDQPFVVMDFVFASEAPATKYTIGKTILPEGAATFNLTVTEAAAGEEVTATIDPTSVTFADGWGWNNINEHSLVSLKTESGVDVPFTINDATRSATFTMPAENVIATFQLFQEYEVSLVQAENGTYKVDGHEAGTGMKRYEGEVSEFTEIVPDDGYKLGVITVTAEDGTNVPVTDNKFTMPAQKVTVTVTFVPQPVDVTVNPEDINEGDITAAIAAKAAGKPINNLTVNLSEGGSYNVSAAMEVGGNVIINGEGATIDASALTTPMIQMTEIPADAPLNEKDAYLIDGITIKNVTITGLPYQLIYGNKQKYLMSKIVINNSIIGVNGTNKKTVLDFNGGGNASEILINTSTLWANPSNEQNGGLFSSQSGQGSIQDLGSDKQLFAITNSTIYNIAYGKTTSSQRRNSTAGMEYQVEGSIIVNSGKSGQFIAGLNGGAANSAQTYTISGNVFNFDGADVSAAEQAKVQEKIADKELNSVAGIISFTDANNGDFNGVMAVEAISDVVVGDPRWIITQKLMPIDVVIEPSDINEGDITAAIAAKANSRPINNLTITLSEGGSYAVSATMAVGGNVIINGEGATIDASALTTPMIQMTEIPADAPLNEKDAYLIDGITIKNVTITGLPYQLIYGNKQKYLMSKIVINNSIIGVNGTNKKTVLDFNGGGNASEILINTSTLWANPSNEQNGGLFSSQSGQGSIQDLGSDKQLFAITNSTIYNIAYGKTTSSQRRNSTAGMEYQVEGSIIVNSGKSGQFIAGLNGGAANSAQTYTISGNVFNFDGADVSAAEQAKVQEKIADKELNSVAGIITFADAANGDFTPTLLLAPGSMSAPESIGDPRWIPLTLVGSYSITVDENIENGTVKADAPYAAVGTEIKVTATPAADYELETLYYEIEGDNGIYEITDGKFDMPNGNVTIKATFKSTATGISSIENGQLTIDNDAPAYNLAGQKVSNSYKGVVIKNGRKVVIK